MALQTKLTKKATDDKHIATNKTERSLEKLADLQRTSTKSSDARMYPGCHVPVLIVENGESFVRPMRYHCRIAGLPEKFDSRFSDTYNARLDSLDGILANAVRLHPCRRHPHGLL